MKPSRKALQAILENPNHPANLRMSVLKYLKATKTPAKPKKTK
jgi:hypothetical protein